MSPGRDESGPRGPSTHEGNLVEQRWSVGRKVVVYSLVSLDGVAEAPDRFFADWDEVMDANLARVIATQDAVVLGRRTHDEWAGYWPGSDVEPFATFINGVEKHVATSTPLSAGWAHATAVEGGLAEHV